MDHSEDVISEFEDTAGNEGLEDVDSGELATATENFANSEGKDSRTLTLKTQRTWASTPVIATMAVCGGAMADKLGLGPARI